MFAIRFVKNPTAFQNFKEALFILLFFSFWALLQLPITTISWASFQDPWVSMFDLNTLCLSMTLQFREYYCTLVSLAPGRIFLLL